MDDRFFMREAINEARKALEIGEVPIGAVVVCNGKIVGRGHNLTESTNDPTAHAEILAIREAAKTLKNWRLTDCILYSTVEPCIMCTGALILARVKEVVYGVPDPKFGGSVSLYSIPTDVRLNHNFKVRKGPFGDEIAQMMRDFFRNLRKERHDQR